MSHHDQAMPIKRKLLTPGVWPLLALAAVGLVFGIYRFLTGLEATTNLDQQYPWGIWIVADVSFIALAAGGFVMAAVAHVFNRHQYHILARPALLVALLGYTFACVALAADLGRYYNIWHPILPQMWQGNSALFEVGICVVLYLNVLYVEFSPILCERFVDDLRYPRLAKTCQGMNKLLTRVMPIFVVLGVGISCCHQSSLGHVMVLAPSKLHHLWWTPVLALMFLLSAIMAGIPTVIFAMIYGSKALGQAPPMKVLSSLAKYIPFMLMIYLGAKLGDMFIRESYVYLAEFNRQTVFFLLEIIGGLVVPLILLLSPQVRKSPNKLAFACLLVMLGVVLNRANVYWIGYQPAYTDKIYFPTLTEWMLTIGAVAMLLFLWRAVAIYFPVVTPDKKVETA